MSSDVEDRIVEKLEASNARLLGEVRKLTNERNGLMAKLAAAPRTFPIQTEPSNPSPVRSVPWSVAERAYGAYSARFGKDQSLERLAERGGFGAGEMDMFAPGWRDEVSELARLRTLVIEFRERFEPFHQDTPLDYAWLCRGCAGGADERDAIAHIPGCVYARIVAALAGAR